MSTADILRLAIIVTAMIFGFLWIYIGWRSHAWLLPLLALVWLFPVVVFFLVRFLAVTIPVTILNLISLSLYLIGVAVWGGVAVAKLQTLAARGKRE